MVDREKTKRRSGDNTRSLSEDENAERVTADGADGEGQSEAEEARSTNGADAGSGAAASGGGVEEKTDLEEAGRKDEGVSADEPGLVDEEGTTEAELTRQLDELRKSYDELRDRYIRLVADFDNYKKRVAKEKADIMAYGNEELIKELLGVLDNLERAIEHAPQEETEPVLVTGIKLVHRQLLSTLEKFGVKPIKVAAGDKFDPRYHHAIDHVEAAEITPGLVLSEILKGYMLKDKLLRPSLVAVSKAKPEEESAEDKGDS